jgi:hypothetical protein
MLEVNFASVYISFVWAYIIVRKKLQLDMNDTRLMIINVYSVLCVKEKMGTSSNISYTCIYLYILDFKDSNSTTSNLLISEKYC